MASAAGSDAVEAAARAEILRRWPAARAAARAARKPDGFVFETSFSSSQPMHGWDLFHAIRELWQNLRDGLSDVTQRDLSIAFAPTGDHVLISIGPEALGVVDLRTPNVLTLHQRFAVLSARHLILASTKDPGSRQAGCHGEGFKVAINFLLRHGFSVEYAMDGALWTFSHVALHDSVSKSMVVTMRHGPDREDMAITIRGPRAHTLFRANADWDLLRATCKASAQSLRVHRQEIVLSTDPALAGRVYNRCLFVAESEHLCALGLCVNLDMALLRDRHALPLDLADKVADALEQAMAVFALPDGSVSPAVRALCDHLLAQFASGDEVAEQWARPMRRLLRSYCGLLHRVPPEAIIFLPAGDPNELILRQLGLVPIPNVGALADRRNIHQLVAAKLEEAPRHEPSGEPARARLMGLHGLAVALQRAGLYYHPDTRRREVRTAVKAIGGSAARGDGAPVLCKFSPRYHGEIYFTPACIETEDGWSAAAPQLLAEMAQETSAGRHAAMSRALTAFVRSPETFDPSRYVTSDTTPTTGSPPKPAVGGGPSGRAVTVDFAPISHFDPASAAARATAESHGAAGAAASAAQSQQSHRSISDMRFGGDSEGLVNPPPFAGPVRSFGGHTESRVDLPVECRIPSFNMAVNPYLCADGAKVEVTFEEGLLTDPEFRALTSTFGLRFEAYHRAVQLMAAKVAAALRIPPLSIVYVVCRGVMGWNYRGGIYLNLLPIVHADPTDAPAFSRGCESLFATLLHEIAHFRHTAHDTHFSDHLFRLGRVCRNCL